MYENTSAEQIHQGRFNADPRADKDMRLFIDLDVCAAGECKKCVIKCSYYFHPENCGIISCAELASYALVCRKCEEPHCVNSCPVEALEQQKDKNKLLIRHNMRCISCKSCSHACPYGTIYPENVPYLIHNCDFCLGRRDKKNEPLCISSCPYGALSLKKADAKLDENTFLAGDNLIVHATHWQEEKA
ncbi:MAG: 4Fe-4S binding protein [Candidatus Omnitrophica bacterium]|nr:4Fe-4S binding protein [Candidatus Omnitrophota bacterium]MBU1925964.1 4Fe-4S binding protein [Candidatus Omnitrophota bacterium]